MLDNSDKVDLNRLRRKLIFIFLILFKSKSIKSQRIMKFSSFLKNIRTIGEKEI